ncbi:MAG: hypothetical protein ACI8UD_002582 [Planctomycetota bacterium]|jgi:hypothetical protein
MTKLISTLTVGLLASSAMAQACFEPAGTPMGIGQDTISAAQPIGFAFPFAGNTYTDIHISDHGICWLSNAGVPAPPAAAAPLVYSPVGADLALNGPVICPLWTDTIPGAIGDVFLGGTATTFTATWQDMVSFGGTQTFSFQMTLTDLGEIKFVYDANATNNSTFGGVSDNGVVGCSPGAGAVIPASVDLSSGPITVDDSTYEEFLVAATFDMQSDGINMIPVNPGHVVLPLGGAGLCASSLTYGSGCGGNYSHMYEFIPAAAFDLAGTTITMLRTGAGYTALDSIPGVFMVPTAAAVVVALGDDIEETVALSSAMPIPGGTTMDLTVSSNGNIALGSTGNGSSWTPDVTAWLNYAIPCVSPHWHDLSPQLAGSGTISFEEVGGIAIVSWNGVFSFGTTIPETFQVQFNLATGDITIVYDATHNNTGNAYLVGMTAGGTLTDNGGHDLSTELFGTINFDDVEVLPLELASNRPVLGGNWDLTTSNIDAASPLSITFFGNGQGPGIPFSAIGLNAPGCNIWINTVITSLTGISASGTSTVTVPIPNNPAFAGGILTAQSICLTLLNPANLLGSNGAQGTVGF